MTADYKRFEIGKVYQMSSACDHNCIWSYEVIARTECTVTLKDTMTGKIKKHRIIRYSEIEGRECLEPLGRYSMRPILRA